ncbi:MAG: hypothetical protein JNM91_04660 [Flavobacteriales bacterium]|nr:hypothetical protein [Flavobacteriales bacterium]
MITTLSELTTILSGAILLFSLSGRNRFVAPDTDFVGSTVSCATPLPPDPNAPPSDFVVSATPNFQWVVNGTVQPTLNLVRGETYTFDLTAFTDEHPFLINNQNNNPFGTIYLAQSYGSVVTFTPTSAMPNSVYYHCSIHSGMVGWIDLTNACPGDLNTDLQVNSTDFGLFVGAFGSSCSGCSADLNDDGSVNSTDFGLFVASFGSNCS